MVPQPRLLQARKQFSMPWSCYSEGRVLEVGFLCVIAALSYDVLWLSYDKKKGITNHYNR